MVSERVYNRPSDGEIGVVGSFEVLRFRLRDGTWRQVGVAWTGQLKRRTEQVSSEERIGRGGRAEACGWARFTGPVNWRSSRG
ncbi:hypothetical protein P152DRAFT_249172 [Eremomyces bilateralis CBS 781.70]|uniref:Uncharacterized protein n=1 Tax=Eremomyces bilateralis CBS 781.70 TaxID=1392243 RepID=A0A6G1GBE3_9PEZI|nr:uncharacterized protein P152DRAFT_249172 [Eremomyces bilateralis CBS 781.70]KAF1815221.1 hypothetical protein P152DRAFT_249172 [Eremomyces bilateralis CBS 781.70]